LVSRPNDAQARKQYVLFELDEERGGVPISRACLVAEEGEKKGAKAVGVGKGTVSRMKAALAV
jgi:hypothetical protein